MPFNVNDFIAATKDGFAREAQFEISITRAPSFLTEIVEQVSPSRQLSFLCGIAELPTRNMETVTYSRYGLGLQQQMVVGASYAPLNLNIYCDAKAENIKILHRWMNEIFPPDSPGRKINAQHVEFKDNYETEIELTQYNTEGQKIANWKFYEAFPISLRSINFNWAARNSFIIIPATFAYTYYIEEGSESNASSQTTGATKPTQNSQLPRQQFNIGSSLGNLVGRLINQ